MRSIIDRWHMIQLTYHKSGRGGCAKKTLEMWQGGEKMEGNMRRGMEEWESLSIVLIICRHRFNGVTVIIEFTHRVWS